MTAVVDRLSYATPRWYRQTASVQATVRPVPLQIMAPAEHCTFLVILTTVGFMAELGPSDTSVPIAGGTPEHITRKYLGCLSTKPASSIANDSERQAAGVTKSSRILNAAEEPLSTSMSSTYRMASRRAGSRLSSSGLV
jgi:hypothetical protein